MSAAASRSYAATPGELQPGTLSGLLLEAADRWGGEEAFRHKVAGEWRSLPHDVFLDRVRRVAGALRALGIGPGDRLGLLSENRPEWALADFAALCLGAIDVPIYATLPANQIVHMLRDSGARLVFVSDATQLEKVRSVRSELPALERIIVFDDGVAEGDDGLSTLAALETGPGSDWSPEELREAAASVAPEDVATIIYTSGTTGLPKGVMLTHANIRSNVQACQRVLPIGTGDVALSLLPLSHIFERMVDYFLFLHGCVLAYAESFDRVSQNMLEVRPTIVASVPRLYEKIYARITSATGLKGRIVGWARRVADAYAAAVDGRPLSGTDRIRHRLADRLVFSKLRERTGGRLRFFISGGAPLEPEVARFFYAAGLPILEGYGLTETSPVTNVNTPDELRFGTVGKPVPGTEIRIAEDGEILVRGPQVMKGYYRQPEATREVLDEEGWFHTGDVGSLDEEGYLRITDRKKDLIVTAGGKNIAPQPIENRVKTSPLVEEAVMVGDRRPYAILLVVPNEEALRGWAAGADVPADDLAALVRDARTQQRMEQEVLGLVSEFARYERPKRVALLERPFTLDGGELTPSLKVKRRVVEERYADVIEGLYRHTDDVAAASDLD